MTAERVCVVTGAGRGIGRAIARRLIADGWRVAGIDVIAEGLTGTGDGPGERAFLPVVADVGDEVAVGETFATIANWTPVLHGLVNNAGIAAPHGGDPATLPTADWERVLRTNLTGPFLVARTALPLLRRAHGAIVNIASTRALQSEPRSEAYAASKGDLVAMTHALAASCAGEVRVNCICPGWIDTGGWRDDGSRPGDGIGPDDHAQHFAGRVGRPEDVAATCAFLLGDEAGFVSGECLVVDGGMTRKMVYLE